jgi:tetratricopeptide (TPR) repeat protein
VKAAGQAVDEARQWNAARAPGEPSIDEAELVLNVAQIEQKSRRFPEALAVLDKLSADKLSPRIEAGTWLLRAQIHSAQGDVADALAAFRKHAELAPDVAEGWLEFGEFEAAQGDAAAARPLLERAVELEPRNEAALFNLARAQIRLGEREAGAKTMERYRAASAERVARLIRLTAMRNQMLEKADGEKRP